MNTPPEQGLQGVLNNYLRNFLVWHAYKNGTPLPRTADSPTNQDEARERYLQSRRTCFDLGISNIVLDVINANAYQQRPAVLGNDIYLVPKIGTKSNDLRILFSFCTNLGSIGPFYTLIYDEYGSIKWLQYTQLPESNFVVVPAIKITNE